MVTYEIVHEWMALANLIIMMAALFLIGFSLLLEKKKKWNWHGNVMLLVMTISGLLLIAHMGPSLVSAVIESVKSLNIVAITGVIHGVIGAFALFLGLWLVGVWAFTQSGDNRYCFSRKKVMWKILTLWLVSLGLGVSYYVLHITLG